MVATAGMRPILGSERGVKAAVSVGRRTGPTFGFDVLRCPRCGGRLRWIALIEESAVIERLLRHLGVPTQILAPPSRPPPLCLETPDQDGPGRRRADVRPRETIGEGTRHRCDP
jgi:hypothetical protein